MEPRVFMMRSKEFTRCHRRPLASGIVAGQCAQGADLTTTQGIGHAPRSKPSREMAK
ncbi:hypothetical protein KIN20_005593 [Parelaphostrongylus tenuis]|uniref:Uncharacterized protein n=1 Tax=Parelaphostrongylus tenuis TaxID=148309 RepID=A0AAD5QKA2_PARTN|nr:hypothetical protein KIN20_005593 [Parelaphostrongylus tenuis]